MAAANSPSRRAVRPSRTGPHPGLRRHVTAEVAEPVTALTTPLVPGPGFAVLAMGAPRWGVPVVISARTFGRWSPCATRREMTPP